MARRPVKGRKTETKAEKKSAWQRSLDLLARRALTAGEVADRLRRDGYAGDEVADAVERLVDRSFVDDRQATYNHVRRRVEEGRHGPLKVRAELLRRGVDTGLVDEALADAFPPDDLRESVRRAAMKMAGSGGIPRDRTGRERIARRLARAGFPVGAVSRWLDERAGPYDDLTEHDPTEDDLT
jgi:regulatory protein